MYGSLSGMDLENMAHTKSMIYELMSWGNELRQ